MPFDAGANEISRKCFIDYDLATIALARAVTEMQCLLAKAAGAAPSLGNLSNSATDYDGNLNRAKQAFVILEEPAIFQLRNRWFQATRIRHSS